MLQSNFSTSILVTISANEVYDAITNVRAWWPGTIEGNATKVGDEFTYRYEDVHYSKQKVTELVPGKRIKWIVTESELNFVEDKDEWTDSSILFEIVEQEHGIEIIFSHIGLVPGVECYEACTGAWTDIIGSSLRNLLVNGKGKSVIGTA